MEWIWNILQMEETTDERKIKRAYAVRAKEIHPEESPQAFQMLYQAYQSALQSAACGKRKARKEEGAPKTERGEEDKPVSKGESICNIPDADSEELKKQWIEMGELKYFQSFMNKQISLWGENRVFLDKEWENYLQSERFQEIMWNPIVIETIAESITKHFQGEQEILLFFWELYAMDIYEKWGEDSFDEESLRTLYRSLYSVSKEGQQMQRMTYLNEFMEMWKISMRVLGQGGGFGKEWKEYLQSERFQEIMWSDTVLNVFAAGIGGNFLWREEEALFVWNLYGFEKLGAENCKGKSLELYRVLYPFRAYQLRREEYEKGKEDVETRKKRQIYGLLLLLGVSLLLLLVALMTFIRLEMDIAGIVCIFAMIFVTYYIVVKRIGSG